MPTERWTNEMLRPLCLNGECDAGRVRNAQLGLSQRVEQFITRTDETITRLDRRS